MKHKVNYRSSLWDTQGDQKKDLNILPHIKDEGYNNWSVNK